MVVPLLQPVSLNQVRLTLVLYIPSQLSASPELSNSSMEGVFVVEREGLLVLSCRPLVTDRDAGEATDRYKNTQTHNRRSISASINTSGTEKKSYSPFTMHFEPEKKKKNEKRNNPPPKKLTTPHREMD